MEPWGRELIDTWNRHTLDLAKALQEAIEQGSNVVGKYRLEDLEQMMRGWAPMMEEELEGRGTDNRDAYLQVVIPGILAQGDTLDVLMLYVMQMAIRSHSEMLPRVSEANRKQISDFLTGWLARYGRGVVQIGLETLAASR